jgi:hypothetical protein
MLPGAFTSGRRVSTDFNYATCMCALADTDWSVYHRLRQTGLIECELLCRLTQTSLNVGDSAFRYCLVIMLHTVHLCAS